MCLTWADTLQIDYHIGDVVRFIDYRGKTPKKTKCGLRLITAKNVKMGRLEDAPMEFVAENTYDSWMTRGIPELGDVLFTTEAPLANVAQLDTSEKVVFAQRIIIMQPERTKLDSTLLKYLLMSRSIQERIHSKGTGATVKGIKASLLKLVRIYFPRDIHEQRGIVTKLDSLKAHVERLALIVERKLANLAELKQSILRKAFAGELTGPSASSGQALRQAQDREEFRAEGQSRSKNGKTPSPQPSPNGRGGKRAGEMAEPSPAR